MKGTFFSADFIKDENDNLRLLEINTDTACITYSLESRFDFSDWITIMQNNNITKPHFRRSSRFHIRSWRASY